jgi:hypothetical protein
LVAIFEIAARETRCCVPAVRDVSFFVRGFIFAVRGRVAVFVADARDVIFFVPESERVCVDDVDVRAATERDTVVFFTLFD